MMKIKIREKNPKQMVITRTPWISFLVSIIMGTMGLTVLVMHFNKGSAWHFLLIISIFPVMALWIMLFRAWWLRLVVDRKSGEVKLTKRTLIKKTVNSYLINDVDSLFINWEEERQGYGYTMHPFLILRSGEKVPLTGTGYDKTKGDRKTIKELADYMGVSYKEKGYNEIKTKFWID